VSDHIGDTNKMISDTPRTDEHNWKDGDYDDPLHAFYGFAGQLERELNAANAIIRQQQLLDEENLRLQDRIKQLKEELMDVKNKYAVLVADAVLYEDRGERIKRLEDIIHRAACAFFRDGSDGQVASGMLTILEEMRKP